MDESVPNPTQSLLALPPAMRRLPAKQWPLGLTIELPLSESFEGMPSTAPMASVWLCGLQCRAAPRRTIPASEHLLVRPPRPAESRGPLLLHLHTSTWKGTIKLIHEREQCVTPWVFSVVRPNSMLHHFLSTHFSSCLNPTFKNAFLSVVALCL